MLAILKTGQVGILTWTRGSNHDHEGGSSRARLLHCTREWLTPAISPNVGNSTSSFLLVGICVRANPFHNQIDPHCMRKNRFPNNQISTSESPGLVMTDGTTPGMRTRFGPLQLCTWKGNQVSFDLLHLALFLLIPVCFQHFHN